MPESEKLLTSAAFGRLCVETNLAHAEREFENQPPSGGCVLKLHRHDAMSAHSVFSRLRAAVC